MTIVVTRTHDKLLASGTLLAAASVPTAVVLAGHRIPLVVLTILALAAAVGSRRRGSAGQGSSALWTFVALLAGALLVPIVWPVTLLLALGVFALLTRAGRVRWDARWHSFARPRRGSLLRVALVVPVSAVGLVVWFVVADPDADRYRRPIEGLPFVAVAVLGLLFVLVNATAEELTFNGIVQSALADRMRPAVAAVAAATCFGIAHWNGFPSGWIGMLLAGAYGLVLAYLRQFSGSLTAPVVAHVLADVTIVLTLLALG